MDTPQAFPGLILNRTTHDSGRDLIMTTVEYDSVLTENLPRESCLCDNGQERVAIMMVLSCDWMNRAE